MTKLRFSTFNVENLFSRPWVMSLPSHEDGRSTLDTVQRLTTLIEEPIYTDEIKTEMVEILDANEFDNPNLQPNSRPFMVQEVRNKLFTVNRQTGKITIVAAGRAEWVGWVDLSREPINGDAVLNTGRVIQKINADIQLLIETENRLTIDHFNVQVIGETLQAPIYPYNLLVDGNDPRGIDIGLFCRFPIRSIRSHISDALNGETIFSRDCAEYEITLPDGQLLWVLGNHFKSKGYGSPGANNRKREKQARRVKEIYQEARQRSDYVIIAGDFNDTPDSQPLKPLLAETDLQDVMTHPVYNGLPGTYDTCTAANKIDYILLSPALWNKVKAVDVEHSGVWAPRAFKKAGIAIMPTVTSDVNSASDHSAVWVDLEL